MDYTNFPIDREPTAKEQEKIYQAYKAAGYYDPTPCKFCDKKIDKYLHKAHESICEKKTLEITNEI